MKKAVSIFVSFFLTAQFSNARFKDSAEKYFQFDASVSKLLDFWGTLPASEIKIKRPVKIAILDSSFAGFENQLGKTIPPDTGFYQSPDSNPLPPSAKSAPNSAPVSSHGLKMAELVSFIATDKMKYPERIELHLYNSVEINFESAVEDIIKWKPDLVLYMETWPLGGNHDGKGFINKIVNRAVDKDILWINTAGNSGALTYNGNVKTLVLADNKTELDAKRFEKTSDPEYDGYAQLPDRNNGLKIHCNAPAGKSCFMQASLTWTAFNDDIGIGTEKDLDLYFYNDAEKQVAVSNLIQIPKYLGKDETKSTFAQEEIVQEIPRGTYFFKVKNSSRRLFDGSEKFRISLNGDYLEMPKATRDESLSNPADNPKVITVGAIDSEESGMSKRLGKPELWAPSTVLMKTGDRYSGSSYATAFVGGLIALLKMQNPEITREEIIKKSVHFSWNKDEFGQTAYYPKVETENCSKWGDQSQTPAALKLWELFGGKMLKQNGSWTFVTPFKPQQFNSKAYKETQAAINSRGFYTFDARSNPCYRPYFDEGQIFKAF